VALLISTAIRLPCMHQSAKVTMLPWSQLQLSQSARHVVLLLDMVTDLYKFSKAGCSGSLSVHRSATVMRNASSVTMPAQRQPSCLLSCRADSCASASGAATPSSTHHTISFKSALHCRDHLATVGFSEELLTYIYIQLNRVCQSPSGGCAVSGTLCREIKLSSTTVVPTAS
jgi:hypothetical protein